MRFKLEAYNNYSTVVELRVADDAHVRSFVNLLLEHPDQWDNISIKKEKDNDGNNDKD